MDYKPALIHARLRMAGLFVASLSSLALHAQPLPSLTTGHVKGVCNGSASASASAGCVMYYLPAFKLTGCGVLILYAANMKQTR